MTGAVADKTRSPHDSSWSPKGWGVGRRRDRRGQRAEGVTGGRALWSQQQQQHRTRSLTLALPQAWSLRAKQQFLADCAGGGGECPCGAASLVASSNPLSEFLSFCGSASSIRLLGLGTVYVPMYTVRSRAGNACERLDATGCDWERLGATGGA